MQINDLINGIFELGGAILTWINVYKLHKDKETKGIYWPIWVFFSTWGIWNLFYYTSLDHYFSFYAGVLLVSGNLAWVLLAYEYSRRDK